MSGTRYAPSSEVYKTLHRFMLYQLGRAPEDRTRSSGWKPGMSPTTPVPCCVIILAGLRNLCKILAKIQRLHDIVGSVVDELLAVTAAETLCESSVT